MRRPFLTADGESGKAGGNETIRVDGDGHLRIEVPAALAGEYGTDLIGVPVGIPSPRRPVGQRRADRQAVRYDITFDSGRERWYLDASWTTDPEPLRELHELRAGRVLGVDLNVDHLAACVLDASAIRSGHRSLSL